MIPSERSLLSRNHWHFGRASDRLWPSPIENVINRGCHLDSLFMVLQEKVYYACFKAMASLQLISLVLSGGRGWNMGKLKIRLIPGDYWSLNELRGLQ